MLFQEHVVLTNYDIYTFLVPAFKDILRPLDVIYNSKDFFYISASDFRHLVSFV